VDCVLNAGHGFGALAAALSATQEMEEFRITLRDSYYDTRRRCHSGVARAEDALLDARDSHWTSKRMPDRASIL
jgi:hypothetical protein